LILNFSVLFERNLQLMTFEHSGFHCAGFLIPFFPSQFERLAGVVPQRFAMNFRVDPFASMASTSGRNGSSLLSPGPFGLPSGRPAAFLALSASLVPAETGSRHRDFWFPY